MDGVTESGAIYMEESEQKLEGDAWERMKKIYEEHTDWYVQSPGMKKSGGIRVFTTGKRSALICMVWMS